MSKLAGPFTFPPMRLLARFRLASALALAGLSAVLANAQTDAAADPTIARFDLPASGPVLERTTTYGSFFDVVGRRAAVFGYENKPLEAWVYPLKAYDDFRLDFALEGYPVPIDGLDVMRRIEVRPEATTLVYAHPAFTVRQVIYAPIDEMGVVQLLDVETIGPLTIGASLRPDLSLMWPAGLMTGFVGWEADAGRYFFGEETQRFYAMVGSPGAVDNSVLPYQEEPQDIPNRFTVRVTPAQARAGYVPIVTAGSVTGREACAKTYDRLLGEAESLYRATVEHYRRLETTVQVSTPDARLDEAYQWAKVGMDKGVATNPGLGTGLVAGYRTSGNSERPGFAWFFGRDALWTALATSSVGDLQTTRDALDFLARWQRDDGKVTHEVSQSAHLLDWFDDYLYPWASADATPLFVIVLADYYRQTGDAAFLRKHYEAARRAYAFHAATDRDGDGLYENTGVGHAWVEGGALYPPHEELYLQGLFVQASRDMAEMADAQGDAALARTCRLAADRTTRVVEERLWVDGRGGAPGYYAFGTAYPKAPTLGEERRPVSEADNKENTKVLAAGQQFSGTPAVVRENTALQGVPLWWGLLDSARAQGAVTHMGRGAVATPWGARILDKNSALYDPLSYHNGSVWPLFTGWTSMGAYAYGRPHVGAQGLYASALLTRQDALGYVTELLSGDFNAAFGRTSHHQIWSEAMVASPLLRGMLGLDFADAGRVLRLSPRLPADWDSLRVRQIPVGEQRVDVRIDRSDAGAEVQHFSLRIDGAAGKTLELAPGLPRDAVVRRVTRAGGAELPVRRVGLGDVALYEVRVANAAAAETITYELARRGSDVAVRWEPAPPGGANAQIRVLRSLAGADALELTVEGLTGTEHMLQLVSDRSPASVDGGMLDGDVLTVEFAGAGDAEGWVRRVVRVGWR